MASPAKGYVSKKDPRRKEWAGLQGTKAGGSNRKASGSSYNPTYDPGSGTVASPSGSGRVSTSSSSSRGRSKPPRARRSPLATPEVESAVERLRSRYTDSGRTAEEARRRREGNTERREDTLDDIAASQVKPDPAMSRIDFIGKQNQARQNTALSSDGKTVKKFRGRGIVGTPPVKSVRRAAKGGKLKRDGQRYTTPDVRQARRQVRKARRQLGRARAEVARSGMPANVPPEYARWIRKYAPRIDKQARATYGISGNEFMAKMLQGESGFDMSKVGPSTPYGNARGAAQFIPPTRDAFVEKFGIDPWRSTKEAVQAMALHLDGKSYSKTFGIQGYNPGINDSYYLNQDVGPVTQAAPGSRRRLNRAKSKFDRVSGKAAKLGLGEAAQSEDRYKGPLPDNATVWPLAIRGTMGGGPEDHAARAFGNWMSDNAVDINVPVGTPVRAVKDAVVTRTSGSAPNHAANPAGWTVYLKDKDGEEYSYMHLEEYSVKPGDKVKAGQVIGKSGAANSVPHLHFATLKNDPRDVLSGATTKGGSSDKPKFVNYSKKGGVGTSQTKWLVPTGGNEFMKFQRPLAEAMIQLAKASGEPIQVNSAFRTRAEQEALYQAYLNGTGNLAAKPGTSQHEFGAAVDVNLTPKQRELAPRFGLGFPVAGEDWHMELVGDAANQIESITGGGSSGYSPTSSSSTSSSTTTGTGSMNRGPAQQKRRQATILDTLRRPAVAAVLRDMGFRVTPQGVFRRDGTDLSKTEFEKVKERMGIK